MKKKGEGRKKLFNKYDRTPVSQGVVNFRRVQLEEAWVGKSQIIWVLEI